MKTVVDKANGVTEKILKLAKTVGFCVYDEKIFSY